MICLYSGTPGSGKSLHIAERLFYLLNRKKDCVVICNFDIDIDNFKYPDRFILMENDLLNVSGLKSIALDFFKSHPRKEDSIFLFIDESQLLFNSRDWNSNGRKEWLSFFTQHRKYGYNIVLVAQFDLMIDKQIRSLIEYEMIHRKFTNFGFIGTLLKFLTFGDWFICVEHWYTINKKTGDYIFRARKKYYSIYDTFKDFQQV